mmetsp:Transcript_14518/g.28403  ORF Transcript_14518/g.28403 Transcript_14518/m.28403 type:complete len:372 (+) Transcript_14518:3007-4122(+)
MRVMLWVLLLSIGATKMCMQALAAMTWQTNFSDFRHKADPFHKSGQHRQDLHPPEGEDHSKGHLGPLLFVRNLLAWMVPGLFGRSCPLLVHLASIRMKKVKTRMKAATRFSVPMKTAKRTVKGTASSTGTTRVTMKSRFTKRMSTKTSTESTTNRVLTGQKIHPRSLTTRAAIWIRAAAKFNRMKTAVITPTVVSRRARLTLASAETPRTAAQTCRTKRRASGCCTVQPLGLVRKEKPVCGAHTISKTAAVLKMHSSWHSLTLGSGQKRAGADTANVKEGGQKSAKKQIFAIRKSFVCLHRRGRFPVQRRAEGGRSRQRPASIGLTCSMEAASSWMEASKMKQTAFRAPMREMMSRNSKLTVARKKTSPET